MSAYRILIGALWMVCLAGVTVTASAQVQASDDSRPLIVHGKVIMQDGTPPPKAAAIMKTCSDLQGSAPGPLTDKKGEYVWRMDVDPMRTRVCYLDARLQGFASTRVDISGLNGFTSATADVATIVLRPATPDPKTIVNNDAEVPAKVKSVWKAAMKAVDLDDLGEAQKQLTLVTEGSPKWAYGWHTLGIVYQTAHKLPEARDAFQHAIADDPKSYGSYVMLARIAVRSKDWQNAANAADALIKADPKQTYPEIYLHQAAARFKLKDLAGAEMAAQTAADKFQIARAELVLGKIAEAKGDLNGARAHINKYIALDPNANDIGQIKLFLQALGKPEASNYDPELETP